MRHSLTAIAFAALLAAALSTPALARNGSGGHAGGRGAHGGHNHSHAGGFAAHRYFAGRPRVGLFLGAPVFAAPYFYPPPGVLAPMPATDYIERPPEGVLYFCPEAGGYYPLVQQCPGGWEMAQAPGGQASAETWDPATPRY